MRILGIDPGARRIGLAVSDELGITAQGLDTFDAAAGGDFFSHVSEIIREYGIAEIVVGHPVTLPGRPGAASESARRLAKELQARFGVEVTLWDERLSSREARRVVKGTRAGKEAVDKVAAVIILQSYLDFRNAGAGGEDGASGGGGR